MKTWGWLRRLRRPVEPVSSINLYPSNPIDWQVCPTCEGKGKVTTYSKTSEGDYHLIGHVDCPMCCGRGWYGISRSVKDASLSNGPE
jgi:hypothetical protein